MDLSTQLSNPEGAALEVNGPASDLRADCRPKRALQVQHRLSIGEVAQLVDAYRAGASARELSAAFGIHRTTVLDHLARNGIDCRVSLRKLSDEQVATAADM